MKKIICVLLISSISLAAVAQKEDDEKKGLFKKENCFTGGTMNASFGNQFTSLGISPFFGYSINRFVDVAASVNFSYISQRDVNNLIGNKLKQTVYGPGAFVRVFPLNFLFAQAQYEFNFINLKYVFPSNYGLPSEKEKYQANSLLVGGGIAIDRDRENNSYYYISVLWDVAKSKNSPYIDYQNRAVPIFRAGYNIALFQGRR